MGTGAKCDETRLVANAVYEGPPTFTVTGARPKGNTTADILVHATPRAGVGEANWKAQEREIPIRYSGTLSIDSVTVVGPTTWTQHFVGGRASARLEADGDRPRGVGNQADSVIGPAVFA
jgi:hypothetical protein